MKKLKVKLFGESYKMHKLEIDAMLMEKLVNVAEMLNEPLEEAILDLSFYERLNDSNINSINDIDKKTFVGLINNYKNKIEIKYGRKHVARLSLNELFNPTTLFPLYNTQVFNESLKDLPSGLYLEEKDIGLFGDFEIETEEFKIALLKFHLVNVDGLNRNYMLLHDINYNDKPLSLVKSDTLIMRQKGFIL